MDYKEMMGEALKSINDELRQLKKQEAAAIKAKEPYYKLSDQIERREKQRKFYMASKSEPVRFGNGVVVNAKMYKAYTKKLPSRALFTPYFDNDQLIIRWSAPDGSQGSFYMNDLAKRYEGFDLPSGEELLK